MASTFAGVGTGLVLIATGFVLGTVYANWAYDYYLLWVSNPPVEKLAAAAAHYRQLATQPMFLHHVLHAFVGLGMAGLFIKLYKPSESNYLFDGGSLVLFVIAIVFYLTNLRPASHSVTSGDWNDIDESTGLQLMAASQVLIVLVFLGVIALQAGQWYAEREAAKNLVAYRKKEQEEAAAAAAAADGTAVEASTSAATTSSSKKSASKRK